MNGNKFKGNQVKKSKRKEEFVMDYDIEKDKYAVVTGILGGNHLQADIIEGDKRKQVRARIMGIHYRKVYFKKDDLIVVNCDGNIFEVRGRVNDNEIDNVKKQFTKSQNKSDIINEEDTGFDFENI
jgi:hypothetical protein